MTRKRDRAEQARDDLVRRAFDDAFVGESFGKKLRQIGDPTGLPRVLELIASEHDVKRRRWLAYALRYMDDPAVVPPLIDALDSTDVPTRRHAIEGLGNVRARQAVPSLIELLSEPRWRVRAATALVRIRDERALEPLARASRSGIRGRRKLRQLHARLSDELGYG